MRVSFWRMPSGQGCSHCFLNSSTAAAARLTGTAIDAKLVLIIAVATGAVHVVPDGRATPGDGTFQNTLNGTAKTIRFRSRHLMTQSRRMKLRLVQRFIRIDVAHA